MWIARPSPLLTTANRTATSCATRRCVSSLDLAEGRTLTPFYWRNDYRRYRAVVPHHRERPLRLPPELYEQHEQFAGQWDKNLRQQGFVEAFDRQQRNTAPNRFPVMGGRSKRVRSTSTHRSANRSKGAIAMNTSRHQCHRVPQSSPRVAH